MNKLNLASYAVTGLFCLGMLPGAVMDIVQPEMVVGVAENLGIPLHILTLIGIWKLLGIAALLQQKWGRLQEWAYAGFFFDLTGAAWWHGAAGDTAGIAPPLVLAGLMVGSYVLRERRRGQPSTAKVGLSSVA